ncbi:ArsC family reductase [Rhodobacteraceae bacterium RKSG542]|nr:ArsC family reductase [Pseudovibrio flavus]
MIVYGIKNCDTVKKARKFLDEAGIAYSFHDYKKDGADAAVLEAFVKEFGWDTILNKRGTTWRKVPDEVKETIVDSASAMALMLEEPSMIKRPLVQAKNKRFVGFDANSWEMAMEMGELV